MNLTSRITQARTPSNQSSRHARTFARTALQAQAAPDIDHLLVLDEINRANVPKVFGDLLLVLEYDKRATFTGDTWETRPDGEAVLHQSGVRFWVPDNLYVLGTMNTSDRSVSHPRLRIAAKIRIRAA